MGGQKSTKGGFQTQVKHLTIDISIIPSGYAPLYRMFTTLLPRENQCFY